MNIRRKRIAALLVAAVGLAGAALFAPTRLALTATLEPEGGLMLAVPVRAADPFEIRFIHSVHRTPVIERYRVGKDRSLVLEQVVYESYGIGNPSSPEPGERFRMEDGKFVIDRMDRRFRVLRLRIGREVANHELTVAGRTYPHAEWSEPGRRIRLEAKRVSVWEVWRLTSGGAAHG
ncbi:DUF1850 domain-containing protein [Paenibacillus sp.]|uniref:DUF1850 domain-containing protein n=1 Tax=Paenibacillus sp. TaxID=58172 RepID=UPI00281268B1|nr:DUF1850 domain-containing protein [Paenibacillus sp.]